MQIRRRKLLSSSNSHCDIDQQRSNSIEALFRVQKRVKSCRGEESLMRRQAANLPGHEI